MALPHTSCVFCDGVYLYDQCTCEAAVEGGLDSAPRCPCGAGRSLPATRAIAEGIDPGTRTHRTSDRPRGTRRQPLSIIARYYRSSACTAVVALQCIVTQTCMFQTSTCMLVACRTILRNFMLTNFGCSNCFSTRAVKTHQRGCHGLRPLGPSRYNLPVSHAGPRETGNHPRVAAAMAAARARAASRRDSESTHG